MDLSAYSKAKMEELGLYFGEEETVPEPSNSSYLLMSTEYEPLRSMKIEPGDKNDEINIFNSNFETQDGSFKGLVNVAGFIEPVIIKEEVADEHIPAGSSICITEAPSVEQSSQLLDFDPIFIIKKEPSLPNDLSSNSKYSTIKPSETNCNTYDERLHVLPDVGNSTTYKDQQILLVVGNKQNTPIHTTAHPLGENETPLPSTSVENNKATTSGINKVTWKIMDPVFEPDVFRHIVNTFRKFGNGLSHTCGYCKLKFRSYYALRYHKKKEHNLGWTVARNFKCQDCGLQFPTNDKLGRHTNEKHKRKTHQCKLCGKKFCRLAFLKSHEKSHVARKFKCTFCEKEFGHLSSMIKHRYSHTTERPFKCSLCPKSFLNPKLLERHQIVHTERKYDPLYCSKCNLDFKDLDEIRDHRSMHRREENLCCNICKIEFKSRVLLGRHKVENHYDHTYDCTVCKLAFGTPQSLKRHSRTHQENKPYICNICDKGFLYPRYLKRHVMRSHKNERPFACKECDKAFVTLDSYYKHKQTHSEAKIKVKCDFCNREVNADNMSRHVKENHSDNGSKPAYPCYVCKRVFRREEMREEHLLKFHKPKLKKIYVSKKKIPCNICSKKFDTQEEKAEHSIEHINEDGSKKKPYECEFCEKRFTTAKLARRHSSIHSQEKPYECKICFRRFRLKEYIKNHMNLHIGVKRHECDICAKKFAEKNTLKNHKMIHTGERPFPCALCNKRFSRAETLRLHGLSHSNDQPHECQFCGKKYKYYSKFRIHLRSHMQQIDTDILIGN